MTSERPYPVQAIYDLQENYSPEHFRYATIQCRKVIAQLIAEDSSSAQQLTRVRILRYLDLQLARAINWVDDEADLMAVVLRSQIDLRDWAEFVSTGPVEAEAFLNEVDIDIQELHTRMVEAFPEDIGPLPTRITGARQDFKRNSEIEKYSYKLCSKLIHPSALMLNHPETTINNAANKQYLAVEVLFYGWLIIHTFHDIIWTD